MTKRKTIVTASHSESQRADAAEAQCDERSMGFSWIFGMSRDREEVWQLGPGRNEVANAKNLRREGHGCALLMVTLQKVLRLGRWKIQDEANLAPSSIKGTKVCV
jgi:hypothetical protein